MADSSPSQCWEREEYSGKESYKGKINFKMVETDSESAIETEKHRSRE